MGEPTRNASPLPPCHPGPAKKRVPRELGFHERLVSRRKERELTQQALAQMVDMHIAQIRRYESGQSQPKSSVSCRGNRPFWRFLQSLHLNVAGQRIALRTRMRRRAWEAANVQLTVATLDTDTTVHTVCGEQMGARKGYNPKNKGKKSDRPILAFLAETKEYLAGERHNGTSRTEPRLRGI